MKTFRMVQFINATPEEVFSAITNRFTIELWSGYQAEGSGPEQEKFFS